MPDDMFGGLLRYKQLKKKIKAIPVVEPPKRKHHSHIITTELIVIYVSFAWKHGLSLHAVSEGDQQQADEAAARSVEDEEVASTSMTARGIVAGPSSGSHLSPEELEFLSALNEDLRRINSFFIDKEEDAVIKLHVCMECREHNQELYLYIAFQCSLLSVFLPHVGHGRPANPAECVSRGAEGNQEPSGRLPW